jgi:hypothetical protein
VIYEKLKLNYLKQHKENSQKQSYTKPFFRYTVLT